MIEPDVKQLKHPVKSRNPYLQTYKVGELVNLVSGGPDMTVMASEDGGTQWLIECWYHKPDGELVVLQDVPQQCLKPALPPHLKG